MLNLTKRFSRQNIQSLRAFSSTYPKTKLEGSVIPDITLKKRTSDAFVDFNMRKEFSGKKVVLFALPGAFTPTCSSTHLPGYIENFDKFKELGVDQVCCLSVNDGFVMRSWGKDLQVDENKVVLLPDGNAEFTKKVTMDCDKSAIGFGVRSWRYSMVIDDNKISKVFSEEVKEGDPFEVSDAETMLAYLKVNK